jgi:hypothetical protein
MTEAIRSTSRSGTRGTARTGLRTGSVSRTPRPHGLFEAPRPAWWQLSVDLPTGGADDRRAVVTQSGELMTSRKVAPGPGTVRVARFIGRLGVVSLPAVEVGLDLDERVVRRHVAKLEAAGWLAPMPWTWGEGSVAWLTGLGVERVGLGGVRAVKAPPPPPSSITPCSCSGPRLEPSGAVGVAVLA